ncbi:MAG: hypothetical protein JWM10_1798 [Myxococcaceae bacterium]|nr:hypothetical protein [Myxococcaceae bacterium]
MKPSHRVPLLLTLAGVAFGALTLHGHAARAQIDPGLRSFGVYESRPGLAPTLLGELFREGADPAHYVEHWVLYPGYENPSATNGVVVTLRPGQRAYRDAADFLARVPFGRGSRYVHTDCLDSAERPTVR